MNISDLLSQKMCPLEKFEFILKLTTVICTRHCKHTLYYQDVKKSGLSYQLAYQLSRPRALVIVSLSSSPELKSGTVWLIYLIPSLWNDNTVTKHASLISLKKGHSFIISYDFRAILPLCNRLRQVTELLHHILIFYINLLLACVRCTTLYCIPLLPLQCSKLCTVDS